MPVFLGLDCGGSSTRALALDEGGRIVHQAQAGPANISSTPEKRIWQSLTSATHGCPVPNFVCGCFAGVLTAEDRVRTSRYLEELFPSAKVRVEPDYAAALFASEEGTDVCVIAGTGSLICSSYQGRVVKTGGRGYLLGDEGAAYHYGRDALIAYLDLREDASPQLRQMVLKLFESEDENTIVSRIYHTASPPAMLAKLAKAVALDAADNQPYALASIQDHSRGLAVLIAKHVRKYVGKKPEVTLSLAGGLWQNGAAFREVLMSQLTDQLPEYVVHTHRIKQPPVHGALQLAREMAHGN